MAKGLSTHLRLDLTTKNMGQFLKLHQGMFKLNTRKNFVTKRVVRHRNRLLREVVESPSLEVFKKHVDMAHQDTV